MLTARRDNEIAKRSQAANNALLEQLGGGSLSEDSLAIKLTKSSAGKNIMGAVKADQEAYNAALQATIQLENAAIDAEQRIVDIIETKIATEENYQSLKEIEADINDFDIDAETGKVQGKDSLFEKAAKYGQDDIQA